MEFTRTGAGPHKESLGTTELYVNGKVVAEGPMRTQPAKFTLSGEGLCIGYDSGDAVSAEYEAPGRFHGGILTFVAGVVLAARPGLGLASLTLLLSGYLLVDGISGAVLAFHVKPAKGWGWMLFSAVMGVLLGFLLLREWPLSGVWAIGTLIGINLVFSGFTMVSIGSAARKVAGAVATA